MNKSIASLAQPSHSDFRLIAAKRFPDALYLEPEPPEPFVALTRSVERQFPEYPPYGGQFQSVIPHLTVARGSQSQLRALEEEIARDARLQIGIEAKCDALVLIENLSGYWHERRIFELADGRQRDG